MLQFKIWLNPYTEQVELKGKNYKLSDEYRKKIALLNNLRISFTVGLLILAYLLDMYKYCAGLIFWLIILSVQVIFLGVFRLFLPDEI